MPSYKSYILSKLVSGRFLLTIIAGGVFAYMSCTSMLDPKDSQTIIGIVITFYFTQKRPDEPYHLLEDDPPNGDTPPVPPAPQNK